MLREAMQERGCPICRLVYRSEERYLEALLGELVTDPETRERFLLAQGVCSAHGQMAMRPGHALGKAILLESLAGYLADRLEEAPQAPCPVCTQRERTEEVYLGDLLRHLPDLEAEYRASDGLCRPHLRQALTRARRPQASRLAALEQEKLAALRQELRRYVEQHDYRNSGRAWGAERDAWLRALHKLAGSRYSAD